MNPTGVENESSLQKRADAQRWKERLNIELAIYYDVRRQRRTRWALTFIVTVFASVVSYSRWDVGGLAVVFLISMLTVVSTSFQPEREARRSIADLLASAKEPYTVNTLAIYSVEAEDAEWRSAAMRGLRNVLPHLKESDRGFIMNETIDALADKLLSASGRPLTVAILKAFEQIGDARVIPAVKAVIASKGGHLGYFNTSYEDRRCVYEAACACLPYLEARAKKLIERSTLLRPTVSPAPASEVLLRPAVTSDSPPTEQLLRPLENGN